MRDLKQYESRLQAVNSIEEIAPVLDYKLEQKGASGVADYISLSVSNLEDAKSRLAELEKEIKQRKSDIDSQIEIIKIGSAAWLEDAGVDKLSGDIVSSITVSKRKDSIELVVTDEESLINAGYFKMSLDKTAVKNAILEGVELEGAHIETTIMQDTLRINRKKNAATT